MVFSGDRTFAGVAANGLTITAASSSVKGLDIVSFFGNGVRLDGGSTTIVNDYIGITTTGSIAANGGDGIFISGSAGNVIGGTSATDESSLSPRHFTERLARTRDAASIEECATQLYAAGWSVGNRP